MINSFSKNYNKYISILSVLISSIITFLNKSDNLIEHHQQYYIDYLN